MKVTLDAQLKEMIATETIMVARGFERSEMWFQRFGDRFTFDCLKLCSLIDILRAIQAKSPSALQLTEEATHRQPFVIFEPGGVAPSGFIHSVLHDHFWDLPCAKFVYRGTTGWIDTNPKHGQQVVPGVVQVLQGEKVVGYKKI